MNAEKRKVVFSLFMASIIILSVVGMAIMPFFAPEEESPWDQPDETPPAQTPLLMTAENVDANIHRLAFNSRIYGYPDSFNVYEISEQVTAVEGIKQVHNARFSEGNELENDKPMLVMDISFDSDADLMELTAEIEEQGIMENVFAYRQAIVRIPQTISMTEFDGNESKEVSFEPHISAFVAGDSQKEDKLQLVVYAQVIGSAAVSNAIEAYEARNISAEPAFFEEETESQIVSIEPVFYVQEEFEYSDFYAENLEADLNALEDVNSAEVSVFLLDSEFEFEVFGNDFNSLFLAQDLNENIEAPLQEIRLLEENDKMFSAIFDSSKAENFPDAKESLSVLLNERNLSFEFFPVKAFIGAELFLFDALEGTEAVDFSQDISNAFSAHGLPLTEKSFSQQGKIELDSVTRPDLNTVIPVTEPVEATLSLGYSKGETVNAVVNFYVSRDELLNIMATDKKLEETIED